MIDVAFTVADARPADVAVVIDVLRATSTATQALASGYERVLFTSTVELARERRGPGRVLAGERCCVMPDGFDQGNSPLDAAQVRGRELVLATTNGAPAIVAATRLTDAVLLGCLLNLDAVTEAAADAIDGGRRRVQLVCSGTDGSPAIEDVYAAGRISAALPGPRSDAALVAEAVARAYQDPADALGASADARVLREQGLEVDIAYCALVSKLDCVPVATGGRDETAVAVDGRRRATVAASAFDHGATVNV